MIIASLIDLFCIQDHGRGPSDSSALPLERDRLLDRLCGHVFANTPGTFSREHPNHFRHRTCRRPLYLAASRQCVDHPRAIPAWNREEAIFSSASVRPPDIGRLDFVAVAKLLADDRPATNFALPRKMHTCIFKIRRKKFTLAAVVERMLWKTRRSISEGRTFTLLPREDVSNVSIETIKKYLV